MVGNANNTLWASFVIEAAGSTIVFVGDSGYDDESADLGARLGVLAQAHFGHLVDNVGFHIAYLFMTSFFLIYVPFSKISHYLYYPFTRWWIGKALGHRGSMPAARG